MTATETLEGSSGARRSLVLKERLKSIAPKVGFPIFYLASLAVFASLTFPYDKLKERIVVTFNAQQRALGTQQELAIDEMSSHWVTGIKAKGVRLTSLPTEPGKPPGELKIEEARAKIALLPLLLGHHDIAFQLDAFGGEIESVLKSPQAIFQRRQSRRKSWENSPHTCWTRSTAAPLRA